MHAQRIKQSVLSVCGLLSSVIVTKITRSPHLGILETHRYNETVEIGKKQASLCFKYMYMSLDKAHKCHKHCVFVDHAYRLVAMCFLLMHTIVQLQYVGRDYQYTRAQGAGQSGQDTASDAALARGVCALKSSSWLMQLHSPHCGTAAMQPSTYVHVFLLSLSLSLSLSLFIQRQATLKGSPDKVSVSSQEAEVLYINYLLESAMYV